MSYSVIILSRDAGNLVPCVRAIWKNEPELPRDNIIVVDDGAWPNAEVHWSSLKVDDVVACQLHWQSRHNVKWTAGIKPFVFARNANLGIVAAGDDDVILLNDDALLETPGGFSSLWQRSQANPEYGVIAAACNNVGNLNQHPQGTPYVVREEPRMVCFVCVLIPRRTIDMIGLLDEEFTGYGFDDDSYCLRVRRAGRKIGIWDGCFVDHSTLKSSYRTEDPNANRERFLYNAAVFRRKYGQDNWGNPVREEVQTMQASQLRSMLK